jgi:nicotinate-nucleotide adenylyltransferase
VADDADTTLPRELAGLVDATGETRIRRVLAAVLRRPALIAELARIGRTSRAAMRHASFDADALGCLTGLDLCGEHAPLVVFGGSFDPPHARHATALAAAMRALQAPAAMVIPAAVNPLKTATPPADAESRLAMCRASFGPGSADFPSEVRLSRIEIERAGPSYTIDTLAALVARRPKLAGAMRFLVGSDSIRGIASWHRWRELLAIARPAVVVRPPDTPASVASFLDEFARSSGFADAPRWLVDVPSVELDSTSIRAAIARGERPPGLADGVWSEITRRRLYGFGDAR